MLGYIPLPAQSDKIEVRDAEQKRMTDEIRSGF